MAFLKRNSEKLVVALAGLLLLGVIILAWPAIRHAYLEFRYPMNKEYLGQRVGGYFPGDWREKSYFVFRNEDYFGGEVWEYRWSKLGTQSRVYCCLSHEPIPEWSRPLPLDAGDQRAIEDAINIATRDRLWEHEDCSNNEQVCDGGESGFEFSFGPHKGGFRIIQSPYVPELRLFLHKVNCWAKAVRGVFHKRNQPGVWSKEVAGLRLWAGLGSDYAYIVAPERVLVNIDARPLMRPGEKVAWPIGFPTVVVRNAAGQEFPLKMWRFGRTTRSMYDAFPYDLPKDILPGDYRVTVTLRNIAATRPNDKDGYGRQIVRWTGEISTPAIIMRIPPYPSTQPNDPGKPLVNRTATSPAPEQPQSVDSP